jgi:hypothetical protein
MSIKNETIHIIGELVAVVGLVFYFGNKNKKTMELIEQLTKKIDDQENKINKQSDLIANLFDKINSIGQFNSKANANHNINNNKSVLKTPFVSFDREKGSVTMEKQGKNKNYSEKEIRRKEYNTVVNATRYENADTVRPEILGGNPEKPKRVVFNIEEIENCDDANKNDDTYNETDEEEIEKELENELKDLLT